MGRSAFKAIRAKGGLPEYNRIEDVIEERYQEYLEWVNTIVFSPEGNKMDTYANEYNKLRDDITIDPEDSLSRKQFEELWYHNLNNQAADEDYSNEFNNMFGLNVYDYLDKEDNPLSMMQNYKTIDFSLDASPAADKIPFNAFTNAKQGIKDALISTFGNMVTTDGKVLSDVIKYPVEIGDEDNIEIEILSNDIAGGIGIALRYNQTVDDKNKNFQKFVSINPSDPNYGKIVSQLSAGIKPAIDYYLGLKQRDANANDALMDLVNLQGIIDGRKARFSQLPLATAKEGTSHSMDFGDTTYELLPYQLGDEGYNRIGIVKHYTESNLADEGGIIADNMIASKAIAGYHTKNYDYSKNRPNQGIEPSYFAITGDRETDPFYINEKTGQVIFADWFIPTDTSDSDEIFARLSLESTLDKGNSDLDALSNQTLVKNPNNHIIERGGGQAIEDRIMSLQTEGIEGKKYSEAKGYIPLTEFTTSDMISIGVNQPFLALNRDTPEAVNKVTRLFSDYNLFITGGGRDEHNVVEEGEEDSKHKEYIALDVLKTAEAMRLARDPLAYKRYGIIQVLTDYDDHIHFVFDPKMKGKINKNK